MGIIIHKLFFILTFVLAEQSNTEDLVEWQHSVQLTWSDFKGQPQNRGDIVALTAAGISFKLSIKERNNEVSGFDVEVFAHFYPNRSWVHKKKSSNHILAHEQLHFDITELYARKFRKEISTVKVSRSIKRDLNKTYQRIVKEMNVMQNNYDRETKHSTDVEMQSAWDKKIDDALKVYSAYQKN